MVDVSPPSDRRVDVLELVADVCRLAAARTDADGTTVSLLDAFGALEPVLEDGELGKDLSGVQFMVGEGPGCDAASTQELIAVPDLRSGEAAARWPVFAAEAVGLGVGAVLALPLGSAGVPIGSLMFFRLPSGGFNDRQIRQAVAASELIGLALVSPGQGVGVSAGLRMGVHQAAGMVMQQTGSSIKDALVLLKATAFSENRPVTELAAEVVAGGRRFRHIERNDGGMT